MTIKYRRDVLAELKRVGLSTYELRKRKIFGEKTIQALRHYAWVSNDTITRAAMLIGCQPSDLVLYELDDTDRAWLKEKGQ